MPKKEALRGAMGEIWLVDYSYLKERDLMLKTQNQN
jgi:hypothetical protein